VNKFPAAGHIYEANFNDGLIVVHLEFDADGRAMTFTDAGSKMPGMKPSETVRYTATEIRPLVYLVHWQEQDRMTVTHLEDFERGVVHSRITAPTGDFFALSGTLKKIPA
jgi:hypothetical protein